MTDIEEFDVLEEWAASDRWHREHQSLKNDYSALMKRYLDMCSIQEKDELNLNLVKTLRSINEIKEAIGKANLIRFNDLIIDAGEVEFIKITSIDLCIHEPNDQVEHTLTIKMKDSVVFENKYPSLLLARKDFDLLASKLGAYIGQKY